MRKWFNATFSRKNVNPDQVKEISGLLITIIGQTVSGKVARAALVGVVTVGGVYLSDDSPKPTPSADAVTVAAARLAAPAPIPATPSQ